MLILINQQYWLSKSRVTEQNH